MTTNQRANVSPTDYQTRAAAYRQQAVTWLALGETTMALECDRYAQRCDLLAVHNGEHAEIDRLGTNKTQGGYR